MSIFLLASNSAQPQAAFGAGPSDSEELDFDNWLLAAGHMIPLMWLFMFSAADLLDHPVNRDEENPPTESIQIPCTEIKIAAERLTSRKQVLNRWFGGQSKLDYHADMFADWLRTLPYKYVSLDWYELMQEEGVEMPELRRILTAIDAADEDVVPALIRFSTVDLNVPFITLQDAEAGNVTSETQHNFFCLMGDGDRHTPPWA